MTEDDTFERLRRWTFQETMAALNAITSSGTQWEIEHQAILKRSGWTEDEFYDMTAELSGKYDD